MYEPIYEKLALKGSATVKPADSVNPESIRVGWYSWRKANSLILGPKANLSIDVTHNKSDNSVTFSLGSKKLETVEFELL